MHVKLGQVRYITHHVDHQEDGIIEGEIPLVREGEGKHASGGYPGQHAKYGQQLALHPDGVEKGKE